VAAGVIKIGEELGAVVGEALMASVASGGEERGLRRRRDRSTGLRASATCRSSVTTLDGFRDARVTSSNGPILR
jgi:hypothetical protein